MKNVLELVRVSTEEQAGEDRGGIPAQRAINRRTARAYNLTIVKTIEIIDVSGARVLQSPGMQELLRLMEDPDVHGVITKEFSRLIRPENFGDYALLQHFIDTDTVLFLPDGPIDLGSKSGRFMGTIRAAMAGLERREILERMQDAKEALRRDGKNPCGPVALPYGVAYTKERGWYFLPEAEKVKRAFTLFLAGEPYSTIAEKLNFARSSVRCILQNPIYYGWRVWDKKHDPSPAGYVAKPDGRQGYRRKIKRTPEEIIRVKVLDGIVNEEDFSRVQQMIELKRTKHWRARIVNSARYTYNGLLVCGDCASLVYTHSSKYDFYVCKSHHPRSKQHRTKKGLFPCENRHMLRKKLEPRIDHLLGVKLRDPDFLLPLLEKYNEQLESTRPSSSIDQQAITGKLNSLVGKRQRILEAFFDGIIIKGERDQRVQEIDREVEVYRNMLMDSEPQPVKAQLNLDGLLSVVEPFAEWEFLEREDRRALLKIICPEISVFQYIVKGITLNLMALGTGGYESSYPKRAA